MNDSQRRLLWHGMFLFLLGLATGLVEATFSNTRMALAVTPVWFIALGIAYWMHLRRSRAHAIVEKPDVEDAPSNFAVVGRYVLSPHTWGWLKRTPLGAGDEIQLTDAIGLLMREYQVNAFHMTGKSHDCGSKMGYMAANVEYASRHPELGSRFNAFLKEYVKTL